MSAGGMWGIGAATSAELQRLDAISTAARALLASVRAKHPEDFAEGGRGYTCEYMRALAEALAPQPVVPDRRA